MSAVETIIALFPIAPQNGGVEQLIVFIYGLAVVSFLGGSQIPAVVMKKKSFSVQFIFSAMFGFILLFVTLLNDSVFGQLNGVTQPFFSHNLLVAIEFLSIPYLFMILLDLHINGHLDAFSWKGLRQYVAGTFLHPWKAFNDVFFHRSVLFSLVSVVLVSVIWILRDFVLSLQPNFTPARWLLLPLGLGESLDLVSRVSIMIPVGLLLWLFGSGLAHIVAEQLDGESRYLDVASLLGLSFLPSSLVIVVDIIELGVIGFGIPMVIFQILGFIPLVLWPLLLIAIAIKTSKNLPMTKAIPPAIVAIFPMVLLVAEGIL